MGTLPEQFFTAGRSQYQAQLDFIRMLAGKAFESAEKVISLNISTACKTVENSSAAMTQLMTASDPRDLLALTSQAQSNAANMLAYGNELLGIAAGVQVALLKQPAFDAPVAPARAAAPAPPVSALRVPEIERVQDMAPPAAPPAEPAKVVKPSKKPTVAVKPPAAAEPVAEATPIAKAVSEVVPAPAVAARPAAATIPGAVPPAVALNTAALHAKLERAPKQADSDLTKPRKKK
ncbi:MAG: phasin family protein [Telluria sp.]|nr:phasin family protein [Telluria sp.]